MDWLIRNRDGSIATFSKLKIEKAVERTLRSTSTDADSREISDQVEAALYMNYFKTGSIPTVEHIKDFIEETLVLRKLTSAARAFILYREKKNEARDVDHLLSGMEGIVLDYLGKADWRVKENSNMNYSLQGLNFYLSSSITRKYWLSRIYTPRIRELQENGDFHIHDLGILGPYCVGWDLMTLLKEGFRGARGKTESSPPAHLRTALGQVVNFFYTLQGEAAGAQAFSSFDTLLAPFIRFDGLDYPQVRQAFQEFLFNVNIPTRVGFQAPFTNITMDLKPSHSLRDQRVIIGGRPRNEVYGDYQHEMNMINRAFAELMMEGDSKGRIFTFPIPTYNLTKDFEWDNEDLQPIWEMTGKYGVPYFSNFVNSEMDPDDARSMCCRLRLDNRELRNRGGGLFGSNPLTGSIGVVTVNLPRIGYTSADEEEFFSRLSYVMDAARESLELKRDLIEKLTEQGLYPYTSHYLRTIKTQQGHYWSNHFSTIGLLGMNECCVNFLGESIATDEGRLWSMKVLDFMRDKLTEFQEETGNLYNLEASPAEGASYSLARKDKDQFPDAYCMGSSNPYYTNSVHLPVTERRDIFGLLEHQDPLQTMFTGGTVVHIFIGEAITDWRMVRKLARSIVSRYHLPYFSFTPTFSVCPVHGYIAGEHFLCPYPHTEEELAEYGEVVDADDFQQLPEGSYSSVDDTSSGEQGSLFLKIGKVSTDV
ncbi:MAG: ribonucleoside triphosphate reductase [Candidatus Fermentibacteraceae bacterium]|nr:ribonucleoside triphosphate reductase [Candidatus Fermentibacteraceae bacterium]MBN2607591.1 ribonucleoside triphosphate reductase [Candidatus Fermentibacteraceae bacterium]